VTRNVNMIPIFLFLY